MSMDMSMTISGSSPTSTMPTMSMASSTSSSSMMSMDAMAMTFFTSSTTPLFSLTWTPNSAGQYVGTCIFLITLAAIFRALLAIRLNLFEFLGAVTHQRKGEAMYGYGSGGSGNIRPWRANEAVWMASMDVLLAGVAYLLMIAVMTMNVGYFLSVLGGVFLGSFVLSRFMAQSAAH